MPGFSRAWFDDFVATTRSELHGYLSRLLASPEDAREVSQEAYLKVYVALAKRTEKQHTPKALLYTTARNLAISRLRHDRVIDRSLVAVTVSEEIRVRPSDPERMAGKSESLEDLLAVINSLPPRRRAVIWLRIAEGMSQKEIAARLGIAISTVEKHLAKALIQCRDTMRSRIATAADSALAEAGRKAG